MLPREDFLHVMEQVNATVGVILLLGLRTKKIEKNKATVAVDCLGRKAKEAEIARMLGIPVPEGLGLEHARELIKSSSRNTQKVTRSF